MLNYFGRVSFEDGTDDRESALSSYDYDDEEFEMLVKAFMQDIHYTTVNQAAMNIACSMVNAGLVALPFVAQEAGIPLFAASMFALSVISGYTSIMVVSMANERRVRTLEDLAECAYGIRGFLFVSVMQLLFSFSLMIITLNVWADIMSDVFRQWDLHASFLHKRHYQIYFGAGIILPLCILKKSMSTLRWTSFVTILAVAGAFIAVVATYVSDSQMSGDFSDTTVQELCQPKGYWWAIIFISVYSFSCNQKVLTIYSSLRRRTAERWQVAMRRGLAAIFLLYTFFGICGYIAKDKRDLRIDGFNFFLSDQHEQRSVFDPARSMVAFSLLLTLPVDSLVAATTWRRLWAKWIKSRHNQSNNQINNNNSNNNNNYEGQEVELTCCAVFCAAPSYRSSYYDENEEEEEEEKAGEDNKIEEFPHSYDEEDHNNGYEVADVTDGQVTSQLHQQNNNHNSNHSHNNNNGRRKMYNRHSANNARRSRQSHSHLSRLLKQQNQNNTNNRTPETSSSSLMSGIYHSFFPSNNNHKDTVNNDQHAKYAPVPSQEDDNNSSNNSNNSSNNHSNTSGDVINHIEANTATTTATAYTKTHGRQHSNTSTNSSNNSSVAGDTDRDTTISYRSYDHSRSRTNSHEHNHHRNHSNTNNNTRNSSSSQNNHRNNSHNNRNNSSTSNNNNNNHNNADDDEVILALRPNHSTAEALFDQYNNLLEVTSPLPEREQVVPTLLFWLCTVTVSLFVDDWTYLAGSLGTISTVLLLFIIPALLYKRLRLVSDYEAIPVVGAIVPNQLFMSILLLLGVAILVFDVLVDGYYYTSGQRIFQQ